VQGLCIKQIPPNIGHEVLSSALPFAKKIREHTQVFYMVPVPVQVYLVIFVTDASFKIPEVIGVNGAGL
jgi:hypothetical protein